VPGAGEVLVAVNAAGVGPWDRLVREGRSGLGQVLSLTSVPRSAEWDGRLADDGVEPLQ
jgi:NADPH:quinone reductase-like Zn-dependent oxidoreductase